MIAGDNVLNLWSRKEESRNHYVFARCTPDSDGSGQNQGLVLYIHSEVLKKFSKATEKVLHLGQCRVGVEWIESSLVEKDLRMKH